MTCPAVIRASSTPLAMLCPGSIRKVEVSIDREHEASAMGTAAHAGMAAIVAGHHTMGALGMVSDELNVLLAYGRRAWGELSAQFPDPISEVALAANLTEEVTLTGHLDLLSVIPSQRRAHIGEWKFGRLDRDHEHQVKAYAFLVFMSEQDVDEVHCTLVWMRDQETEGYVVKRADAIAWRDQMIERIIRWNGVYHPGDHCAHCPRAHDCPAVLALARRDVATFGSLEMAERIQRGLADLSGTELIELRRRAKLVQAVVDSLDEATRAEVRRRGPIQSADGMELRFTESERRELDALKAWPTLQEHFTDEEIAGACKLSLSKLEQATAEKVGRGFKKSRIEALGAKLDEAGAIKRTTVESLRLMRAK